MDFLRSKVFYTFSGFLFIIILSSCQTTYYLKSAYNQFLLLNNRIPIEKVLEDEKTSTEQKEKLRLAKKVKFFAEEKLKLKKTGSYSSYVALDRPYVTYVVSAAPKWELKHYQWDYLFVGEMPYKGFFNLEDAKLEEEDLKRKNFDTYLRGVSAYSTLGWFDDPILSSMMTYKNYDLVNTIIHEMVHTTLYIKNSADFNERMAVFLGNKGVELFYQEIEGKDSPTLQLIQLENEDEKKFSEFISTELTQLENWYKTQNQENENLRVTRIKEIQTRFLENIKPKLRTHSYDYFVKLDLNNARLNVYKTYVKDLSDFEKLYELNSRDFLKFLENCRNLEKHPKPEEGLKDLILLLTSVKV